MDGEKIKSAARGAAGVTPAPGEKNESSRGRVLSKGCLVRAWAIMLALCVAVVSCEPAYAQLGFRQIAATATGSAGGTAVATLAAPSNGQTVYLEHFTVTCPNVAAVETGVVAVTGLAVGTLNYSLVETVAGGAFMTINYGNDPEQAAAANAAVVVTVPVIGSGSACTVTAVGRQY